MPFPSHIAVLFGTTRPARRQCSTRNRRFSAITRRMVSTPFDGLCGHAAIAGRTQPSPETSAVVDRDALGAAGGLASRPGDGFCIISRSSGLSVKYLIGPRPPRQTVPRLPPVSLQAVRFLPALPSGASSSKSANPRPRSRNLSSAVFPLVLGLFFTGLM